MTQTASPQVPLEALPPDCAGQDDEDQEDGDESQLAQPDIDFAELLGPQCVIKRVDKDQKVLGTAKPEEMQRELMTRASAQKRMGACAEHVKGMSRKQRLDWAIDLKARANEFYTASSFDEAARLYNDCLVAMDLDGPEDQVREVRSKLQLPVCTNLAACMIEMGQYISCLEICDVALSVDPDSCRALYRRGLARYRLGDHAAARPDLEAALTVARSQREEAEALGASVADAEAEAKGLADIERRTLAYLGHIRRFSVKEKTACKRMFDTADTGLYADRPGHKPAEEPQAPIDDSDAAIDEALRRARGSWCCCRRSPPDAHEKQG